MPAIKSLAERVKDLIYQALKERDEQIEEQGRQGVADAFIKAPSIADAVYNKLNSAGFLRKRLRKK